MSTQTTQSNPTHTPGPWLLNPGPNPIEPRYATVYTKPGDYKTVTHVCSIGSNHSENWQANARLIAASPDLFKALEACRSYIENDHGANPMEFRKVALYQAHAAIARAKEVQS